MKKTSLVLLPIAMALGLWVWKSKPAKVEVLEEKTVEFSKPSEEKFDLEAMSRDLERLKIRSNEQEAYRQAVEDAHQEAEAYVEQKELIRQQRDRILEGKTLVGGRLKLTADEERILEEINQRAEESQKTFLANMQRINR